MLFTKFSGYNVLQPRKRIKVINVHLGAYSVCINARHCQSACLFFFVTMLRRQQQAVATSGGNLLS